MSWMKFASDDELRDCLETSLREAHLIRCEIRRRKERGDSDAMLARKMFLAQKAAKRLQLLRWYEAGTSQKLIAILAGLSTGHVSQMIRRARDERDSVRVRKTMSCVGDVRFGMSRLPGTTEVGA